MVMRFGPEPSDTEAFAGVMEPEPGDAEYPAPQPAHVRDGVSTAAFDEMHVSAPGEQYEVRRSEYVPAAVHNVLAARFQQERTAKRAAEEELEQARKLIGSGPFVIVKLQSLNALTDRGEAEVRVGFGGGVTRHMLEAVLDIGAQAVRESLPPKQPGTAQIRTVLSGAQEETVLLPEPMPTGEAMHYWREGGGFICGADAGFKTTSPLDVTCRACLEGIPQEQPAQEHLDGEGERCPCTDA